MPNTLGESASVDTVYEGDEEESPPGSPPRNSTSGVSSIPDFADTNNAVGDDEVVTENVLTSSTTSAPSAAPQLNHQTSSSSLPRPPPPPSRPPPVTSRSTSRGSASGNNSGNPPRPPLSKRSTTESPPSAGLPRPRHLPTKSFGQQNSGGNSVFATPPSSTSTGMNMNELLLQVNPLESEAETLILKALDAHQSVTSRNRADTATSLLGSIPAESEGIFRDPPPVQQVVTAMSNGGPSTRHMRSTDSFMSTDSNTAEEQQPAQKPNSQRSVHAKAPSPKQSIHNTAGKTVHETLAGLTGALANMHQAVEMEEQILSDELSKQSNSLSGQGGQGKHHHTAGNVTKPPTAVGQLEDFTRTAMPTTAGGTFLHNANRIFGIANAAKKQKEQQEAQQQADQQHADKKSAAQNWARLRQSLNTAPGQMQPQQHDDDLFDPDVENSVGSSYLQSPPVSTSAIMHNEGGNLNMNGDPMGLNDTMPTLPEVVNGAGVAGELKDHIQQQEQQEQQQHGDDPKKYKNKKPRKQRSCFKNYRPTFFRDLSIFIEARRDNLAMFVRFVLLVVLPAVIISCVLFYKFDNPRTGRVVSISKSGLMINHKGDIVDDTQTSMSWWIMFVFVRQTLTLCLAMFLQVMIVDFMCLGSRLVVKVLGNLMTLLLVQSKGWPFLMTVWAALDFGLLHGNGRFAGHWLYWQSSMGIFNEQNPAGNATSHPWYTTVLIVMIAVGASVSVKRLWLGLYLGKKTFSNYADELSKLVKKVLLLCEVATLARECHLESFKKKQNREAAGGPNVFDGDDYFRMLGDTDSATHAPSARDEFAQNNTAGMDDAGIALNMSQKIMVDELLGEWEDPEVEAEADEHVTIAGILQFRQSLSFLSSRFMFSIAWGDVSRRDKVVLSSQEIFRRLMLRCPDPTALHFEVLASVAKEEDGSLNQDKLKSLIRLLRPDRDGKLSLLDFVKSVDTVYKEVKLLRATVRNSEKIDKALENCVNTIFYAILIGVTLASIGFNPLQVLLTFSAPLGLITFFIGSSSAALFEGFLFILIRRPYGIGDRIHVSNVESDTSANGSASWIVKDVSLFHTIAVYAVTGEQATMSNGSLAQSRVINMARSPNAVLFVHLKFSTNSKFEKIQVFEKALREFIKSRPREWRSLAAFRATDIAAEQGYIGYICVLQHRESWQNIGALLTSKADCSSFCLELSKKLGLRYQSPPLPVDLALVGQHEGGIHGGGDDDDDGRRTESEDFSLGDVAAMFNKKDN